MLPTTVRMAANIGLGLTAWERSEAVRRNAAGESFRSIAADFGVSRSLVHSAVKTVKTNGNGHAYGAEGTTDA